MKKMLVLLLVVAMMGLIVACDSDEGTTPAAATATTAPAETNTQAPDTTTDSEGGRVYVFNWGHFIYPPVLRMFEEEYGIEVIYATYATNEEMYQRVVMGGDFDVLFPSDYMIERMIHEGRLAPINWDNIPNAQHIDDKFWDWAHDPTNSYSVPYMWGTFGLLYNTETVTQDVYSWSILWDEAFEGQIFMYDSSRCSIGVAQHLLGFSINSTDAGELEQARNMLIEQRPLVRAFLGDQVIDAMIGNEGYLATVFSGDARWIMYYAPEHNFVNPVEGVQLFIDSMVIPVDSRNRENAERFINFMTRPDIAYLNTRYIRYSTTNATAFEMLPDYWQNCPIYWPEDEVLARGEVFIDLGDFRSEVELAWTQIMMSR